MINECEFLASSYKDGLFFKIYFQKTIALKPTDIKDPEYFHKVVDCQYACPAHTPVPEYIRLIAREKYKIGRAHV